MQPEGRLIRICSDLRVCASWLERDSPLAVSSWHGRLGLGRLGFCITDAQPVS